MLRIAGVLVVVALTGCATPPGPMPVAPGFSRVAPGGTMKVGHLYFSGKGTYPAFTDAQGRLFSEMCWRDFAKDNVLREIDDYVDIVPDPLASYSGGANATFSLGFPGVASADASGQADAKVSGLKRMTLNATGFEAVMANLGPACRRDIAQYAKTYDIVLLVSAQRADTMTISARAKVDAEASLGKFLGLSPAKVVAGADQTLQYQMVYLSSNLASTAADQL